MPKYIKDREVSTPEGPYEKNHPGKGIKNWSPKGSTYGLRSTTNDVGFTGGGGQGRITGNGGMYTYRNGR